MFSYTCTKCGVKDCFDYMEECVVSIDSIHVKGTYDGFGQVQVQVQGRNNPVIAMPKQHHWQIESNSPQSILLATDIYCNGELRCHVNPQAIMKQFLRQQGNKQWKELNALIGGKITGDCDSGYVADDDDMPRFCVPDHLPVLEELTPELLAKLPTNKSENSKKRKLEEEWLENDDIGCYKKIAMEDTDTETESDSEIESDEE